MYDQVVADLPLSYIPIPFLYGSDRTLPLLEFQQLEKLYFYFGEGIRTAHLKGDYENPENVQAIKDQAEQAVRYGLNFLKNKRLADNPNDPEHSKAAEMLARYIKSLVGARL